MSGLRPQSRLRVRWRRLGPLLALVAFAAGLFALWTRDAERAALARLSGDERGRLYQRTLENLRSTCSVESVALRAYCQQQAEFILKFPECGAGCQALARDFLPRAAR